MMLCDRDLAALNVLSYEVVCHVIAHHAFLLRKSEREHSESDRGCVAIANDHAKCGIGCKQ